ADALLVRRRGADGAAAQDARGAGLEIGSADFPEGAVAGVEAAGSEDDRRVALVEVEVSCLADAGRIVVGPDAADVELDAHGSGQLRVAQSRAHRAALAAVGDRVVARAGGLAAAVGVGLAGELVVAGAATRILLLDAV